MKEFSYLQLDNITGELSGIIRASGDWVTKKSNVIRMDGLGIGVHANTHFLDVSSLGMEIKKRESPIVSSGVSVKQLPKLVLPIKELEIKGIL